MLVLGGRTIGRLVWADADGVGHPITEVWAQGRLVWDGRISASIFAGRASIAWAGGAGESSASVQVTSVEHGSMGWTSVAGEVSSSVGVSADAAHLVANGGTLSTVLDTAVEATDGGSSIWSGGDGDATVTFGAHFDPGVAVFDGGTMLPQIDIVVASSPAAFFSLDGGAAVVSIAVAVDGEPGVLTFAGGAAVVEVGMSVNATDPGAMAWTGGAGTLATSIAMSGVGAVMTLTGGTIEPEVTAGFARQRMVKVGNQAMSGSRAIVPNWTSDGTYPATISSNKLVVQGGGAATIATQNLSPTGNGGGGNWSRIYLMHNGTAIATYEQNGSGGWSCPNWSIPRTVAAGDTIWIETQFDPFGAVTIVNNSFVEVIPT